MCNTDAIIWTDRKQISLQTIVGGGVNNIRLGITQCIPDLNLWAHHQLMDHIILQREECAIGRE